MTDWIKTRDRLYLRLHQHALTCPQCWPGDATGVRIHNTCDDGIVLLTDWFIAKQHASAPTTHQPTTTEATP